MKRNVTTLVAALTLLVAASAASPVPANAEGPLYWKVYCSTPDRDFAVGAFSGKEIGDAAQICHAYDGHVTGVVPFFE